MSEKQTVIIAPHADDEIIGCYEILTSTNPIIIYDADIPPSRRLECLKLRDTVQMKGQLFHKNIASLYIDGTTIYAPDPFFEIHPLHRRWGGIAEELARKGADVIFYTTNMNAPYIHETKDPDSKVKLLEKIYPNQKTLWEYDHKYFLFEGYNKWIF